MTVSDEKLDAIYKVTDWILKKGNLLTLEEGFKDMEESTMDTDEMIAWLTATLPAKTKLPNRAEFYDRVETEIRHRGEWEDGLLDGLE